MLRWLAQVLWCTAVAYIPVRLWKFAAALRSDIGCPPQGDCYVRGSEHLLDLDLAIFATAVLLWPVCIWLAVVRPALALFRAHRMRLGKCHEA